MVESKVDIGRRPRNLLVRNVYELMLRSIIVGELEQGEFLSEVKLGEKFQTSRTPVREACIHLQKEGLLRVAPHKGYVVTEISLDEIRELYQLRQILEPEAAVLAASSQLGSDFFDAQAVLFSEQAAFFRNERPYEAFLQLSGIEFRFHHGIAEASGNRKLAKFMSEIMNQFRRFYYSIFRKSPWLEKSFEEHQNILKAIEAHDAQLARERMLAHIKDGSSRAFQLLTS